MGIILVLWGKRQFWIVSEYYLELGLKVKDFYIYSFLIDNIFVYSLILRMDNGYELVEQKLEESRVLFTRME